MSPGLDEDYWIRRRAAPVGRVDRVMFGILVISGLLLTGRFGDWWFRSGHVADLALYVLLSLAV